MGRPPCCDKSNVKRGLWTAEEDAKILAYVSKYGIGNWTLVPKKAGLNRCGKSCRLRWTNYLKPDLKHDSFTPQEEEFIINLHKAIGSRWSLIAKQLPGRTDNDVKNYWNTKLRKKLSKMGIDPVTHKPFSQILSDYGNISGLQNTRSYGSLNKNINYTTSMPKPAETTGFPNTDMMIRTRPMVEQVQDSSSNENITSWDFPSPYQFHVINQETIQPQTTTFFINEASSSSCSSSSSNVTQLSSPQPYSCHPSQAQILPSPSSFNWNEFLLSDPPPFQGFQQHQEYRHIQGVIMSSTNSSSTLAQTPHIDFAAENDCALNQIVQEGSLESAFDFGGRQTNQRSEASSASMSSFVDAILDKDSEMRAEFPDILDGSFDFY